MCPIDVTFFSDAKWDVRVQDCTLTGRSKCQDVLLRYFDLGDTCCGLLLFMANKGDSIGMRHMDPITTFFLMLCTQCRDKIFASLLYITKTKHLCKEWVHKRMLRQRQKKSQCAGLTRSGWTSTAQSSPCPACPTSAPSSFSFSTLPRWSFISIAAT